MRQRERAEVAVSKPQKYIKCDNITSHVKRVNLTEIAMSSLLSTHSNETQKNKGVSLSLSSFLNVNYFSACVSFR